MVMQVSGNGEAPFSSPVEYTGGARSARARFDDRLAIGGEGGVGTRVVLPLALRFTSCVAVLGQRLLNFPPDP